MSRRFRIASGLVTIGLALGFTSIFASIFASGAARQTQRPVFRGGVNVVYVDAYPRRDGRIVEGLHAEDFQILEDGKPQRIEGFEFIRIEANTPDVERRDPNTKEEGDQQAADPRNRLFVVYFDLYHVTISGAHETRGPLLEFLGRTIGPTDLFTAMTPETPIQQIVFGRRLDTLESELARYATWGERGRGIFVTTPIEGRLETCGTADNPSLGDALVALHREDLTTTSLENLVLRLRDLRDERKNVIFISEGWVPRPAQPQLGNLSSGSVPGIGTNPNNGRLGVGGPQGNMVDRTWCDQQISRLSNIDFDLRFRDLLTLAGRANVSFYPIDVGGLRTNMTMPGDRPRGASATSAKDALTAQVVDDLGRPSVTTLQTLAENTDGRAIVNTNDLGGGLRRIADDLSAYYLLGYSSTNSSADGKFRKIEVKVNQPKVVVAARRGYLAASAALIAASSAAAPAAATATTGVTDALATLSRLRADASLFGAGVHANGGLDLVAEIGSAEMEHVEWQKGTDVRVAVKGTAGADFTTTGHIEAGARGVTMRVNVPDGSTGPWRVSLHLSSGERALEEQFDVAMAAKDDSALVGAPATFRGTASARIALRPVADFQFRRNERLHVEWPVLKPLDERIARVLDRRGQPLALAAAVTEHPDPSGAAHVNVDLSLAPLAEGDYLLELTVGRGGQHEPHLVAFHVTR